MEKGEERCFIWGGGGGEKRVVEMLGTEEKGSEKEKL